MAEDFSDVIKAMEEAEGVIDETVDSEEVEAEEPGDEDAVEEGEEEDGEGEEDDSESDDDEPDDDDDEEVVEDDSDEEDAEEDDEDQPQLTRQFAAIARKEELLREREQEFKRAYNEAVEQLQAQQRELEESKRATVTENEWNELVAGDPAYVLENSNLTKEQLGSIAKVAFFLASGGEVGDNLRQQFNNIKALGAAKRMELQSKKYQREQEERAKPAQTVDTSKAEQYIASLENSLQSTSSTLANRAYSKNPEKALREAWEAAEQLYAETNQTPTAAEVVERLEKNLADLLGETETQPKAKKTKTLSSKKSSVKSTRARKKRRPLTEQEEIEAAVAAMEAAELG